MWWDPMQMKLVALGLITLALVSCSAERSILLQVTSPDGLGKLQLTTSTWFGKPVARAEVSDAAGTRVLKSWRSSDMYPCFGAAAWSKDSRFVIVLFRNCWHGTEVVAFDAHDGRETDAAVLRVVLAERIRADFGLSAKLSDPVAWASDTEQARIEFARVSGRTHSLQLVQAHGLQLIGA